MSSPLYTLIQWTWGLPQNLAGAALWLCMGTAPRRRYHGARVACWRPCMAGHGCLTLGMFILLDGLQPPSEQARLLPHEYGHTVQSLLFGPLFLPVVGLPSVLRAAWFGRLSACRPFCGLPGSAVVMHGALPAAHGIRRAFPSGRPTGWAGWPPATSRSTGSHTAAFMIIEPRSFQIELE